MKIPVNPLRSKRGVTGFFKSLYEDPFKWSIVKSIGFTITAIYIARECRGLELMPSA